MAALSRTFLRTFVRPFVGTFLHSYRASVGSTHSEAVVLANESTVFTTNVGTIQPTDCKPICPAIISAIWLTIGPTDKFAIISAIYSSN